jgi:type IV pilus assembly protein PilB
MTTRLKLGEMLLAKGLIDEAQLAAALEEQRRWGKRLGMTLVLMGLLEEETLIRILASQLKLPVARIRGKRINAEVIELVPVELAEKHRCLPLFMKDIGGSRELFVAMEDPSDFDAQGELGFRIGFRIRPVLVAPTELEDALQRHYHWAAVAGAASEPLAPVAQRMKIDAPAPLPATPETQETPEEPFEDTEPELNAAAAAAVAAAEVPEDTQPDPPDIERAAAELGAFDEPVGKPASEPETQPASEPESKPTGLPAIKPASEPETTPAPRRAPAPPLQPAASPAPRAASPAMSEGVILRALSQLLVEKGLLSREELVERLRTLATKEASERKQS